MFSRPIRDITVLALISLGAAASLASDTAAGAQEVFQERLELHQVEVDLVVTDRQGRPVKDLSRSDFELYRDSARQEILFLNGPSDEASETFASPRGPTEDPRHLVVYVDNLRIQPAHRSFLLQRLGSFVKERLEQGDRISVVAFDGSLDFLITYSSDTEQVLAVLRKVESRPSRATQLAREARRLRQELIAVADPLAASGLELQIESYIERLRRDVARSLAGLGEMIRAASGLPGSTSVLYLSDGIPAWPGEDLLGVAPEGVESRDWLILIGVRQGDDDMRSLAPTPSVQYLVTLPSLPSRQLRVVDLEGTAKALEPLIGAANAHDVTFYPVRPTTSPGIDAGDSRAVFRTDVDHLEPLRQIAESTGGDLVSSGRFESALDELSSRLDAAYTLGFQVSPRGGQPSHTLEVRLAREGLRAHHRRAYAELSEDDRLAAGTLSALLLGFGENPLALALEIRGEEPEDGARLLPVWVEIPIDRLLLERSRETVRGQVSLCWAIRDDRGRRSEVRHVRLPFEISRQKLHRSDPGVLKYETKLRLGRGAHVVALGLRDDRSDLSSFVYARVAGDLEQ